MNVVSMQFAVIHARVQTEPHRRKYVLPDQLAFRIRVLLGQSMRQPNSPISFIEVPAMELTRRINLFLQPIAQTFGKRHRSIFVSFFFANRQLSSSRKPEPYMSSIINR